MGQRARWIAREMGPDRKAAERYLAASRQQGFAVERTITDEAVGGRWVEVRPAPTPSGTWRALESRRARSVAGSPMSRRSRW